MSLERCAASDISLNVKSRAIIIWKLHTSSPCLLDSWTSYALQQSTSIWTRIQTIEQMLDFLSTTWLYPLILMLMVESTKDKSSLPRATFLILRLLVEKVLQYMFDYPFFSSQKPISPWAFLFRFDTLDEKVFKSEIKKNAGIFQWDAVEGQIAAALNQWYHSQISWVTQNKKHPENRLLIVKDREKNAMHKWFWEQRLEWESNLVTVVVRLVWSLDVEPEVLGLHFSQLSELTVDVCEMEQSDLLI